MADFGVDIACITDIGTSFSLVSGLANLGNALARRLITPRGALFYDAEYGYDLRAQINAAVSAQQISAVSSDIARECEKDERVLICSASMVATGPLGNQTLQITLNITTANGPFQFVIGVDKVTANLLGVS